MFGLAQEKDGVVLGQGANNDVNGGVVVEMEYRRKSGRGVREWVFVTILAKSRVSSSTLSSILSSIPTPILLDDHPLYHPPPALSPTIEATSPESDGITFNLGLTSKQRNDRAGVVLPYFDAQRRAGGGGAGAGGGGGAGAGAGARAGGAERNEWDNRGFDGKGGGGVFERGGNGVGSSGEGGRILYDMGIEDDFDDEEDEI